MKCIVMLKCGQRFRVQRPIFQAILNLFPATPRRKWDRNMFTETIFNLDIALCFRVIRWV